MWLRMCAYMYVCFDLRVGLCAHPATGAFFPETNPPLPNQPPKTVPPRHRPGHGRAHRGGVLPGRVRGPLEVRAQGTCTRCLVFCMCMVGDRRRGQGTVHPFILSYPSPIPPQPTQNPTKTRPQEVKEAHGNIVLFIDEIHLVLGAGAYLLQLLLLLLLCGVSSGGPSDRACHRSRSLSTHLSAYALAPACLVTHTTDKQAPPAGRWTRPTS